MKFYENLKKENKVEGMYEKELDLAVQQWCKSEHLKHDCLDKILEMVKSNVSYVDDRDIDRYRGVLNDLCTLIDGVADTTSEDTYLEVMSLIQKMINCAIKEHEWYNVIKMIDYSFGEYSKYVDCTEHML